MNPRTLYRLAGAACAVAALSFGPHAARGQAFRYEPKAKVGSAPSYGNPDPAPRMMLATEAAPYSRPVAPARPATSRNFLAPRGGLTMAQRMRYETTQQAYSRLQRGAPHPAQEPIAPGRQVQPFPEELPQQNGHVENAPSEAQTLDTGSYDGDGPPLYGEPVYGGHDGVSSYDEGYMDDGGCCDDACDSCGNCGCDGWCEDCGPAYIDLMHSLCACMRQTYLCSSGMWRNLNLYTGKQAFKGPTDLGVNGDFGFHGGVNWGSPFWNKLGIGYQLGGSIIASDFEGEQGPLQHRRTQYYVTSGFYHRADWNCGLQGGVVFDWLHDDFYVDMNLTQVRGEISYVYRGHELGFWFANHTTDDTQFAPTALEPQSVTWLANDQFNGFYRYQFCNGAVARSWIGLTSHSDGIFGGDATIPFAKKWAVQTSYNYLLPNGDAVNSNVRESWNLSIAMVWYPGIKSRCDWLNPYRPLMPVADNGYFLERVR